MTSLIETLILLSTLAATGYTLRCPQCVSASSTCSGSSATCPAGQVCGISYSQTQAGGVMTEAFGRTCTVSSQCNMKGSITLQQGRIRTVTACCNTDDCAPVVPPLSTINYTRNGLVCRSCVSADSTWCYTSDTMQCTGDENMCLLQTTKITESGTVATAIRGCATKSICDLGSQSQSAAGVSTEVKFICTNGGTSVHKVVLTPAIVCLLLLKLF
ncbi:phospholipase A2 inhibitor NAI-like [Anomaloglossus baeobatrachus]|uniref:phospholipase A2 inhibitor NAI-like n=1 Tax=Anomaloglossus baeobatrachus TaxID=238106 RepID=UPI003F4FF4F7